MIVRRSLYGYAAVFLFAAEPVQKAEQFTGGGVARLDLATGK